ncbi:hypothetical protein GTY65_35770 [Streptomyces sp. SID8379]|uniref:hypothetical protein n=1 Tax=unclassified Streptomyces TaxID=2593676 RepID=UPI00036F2B0C|nr:MULTISPECIES: hypothetical protein [unclassified Streptomyces]MYW69375.1 hypothetical protein [Streptomyces sp. SID8379]MYW69390.1 hypothetical protein [Streptomyces sp. SID8379]
MATDHMTAAHRVKTPAAESRRRREPGEVFGSGFTMFADMLLVGLLTSLACLPVVTAPAAFAAASGTLRQAAETGTQADVGGFVRRLRARTTARSVAAGLLLPLVAVAVLVDTALLRSDLPGAGLVAPALVLLTVGGAVVALRCTALPGADQLSLRAGLLRTSADPRGSVLLLAAVVLAGLLMWSTPLLLPLLPGPLAFAATVVDLRTAGPDART